MSESSSRFCRLDGDSWSFANIVEANPRRAERLETAGTSIALMKEIGAAFEKALADNDIRFAFEEAGSTNDYRAVIQFNVGADTFDWFFNARSGYRAQFRAHPDIGLKFNQQIVEDLQIRLARKLPDVFVGRRLSADFIDAGEISIHKSRFMASLLSDFSKIWFSSRLIGHTGVIQNLSLGLTGPNILVNGETSWAAPFPIDEHAWLEIKGAFLGKAGAYTLKDPKSRAVRLHTSGEA